MGSTMKGQTGGTAKLIRKVKRMTRRKISAEDKIRIVKMKLLQELHSRMTLDSSGIPAGVYFIGLVSDNPYTTSEVIVIQ